MKTVEEAVMTVIDQKCVSEIKKKKIDKKGSTVKVLNE